MPFASCEFQAFAKEWRVKLTRSSPTYAQSNGQVEIFVSVVKQMLRKADEEGRNPYLALLAYRNTAVTGTSYSPAQMLMSRVLNSKIPIPLHFWSRRSLIHGHNSSNDNDDTRPCSTEERES